MLRRLLTLCALGLLGIVVVMSGAITASSAGTPPVWMPAIEAPGTAALNQDGYAGVNSVSCTAAGTCTAGGFYYDWYDREEAFVIDEKNGSWGTAIEVPGTATLNAGGVAVVNAVSCSSPGNCTAVGTYTDGPGYIQSFVADETNGIWGNAIKVPGTINVGDSRLGVVSCKSDGNCTAGGFYHDASHHTQAWVVDKVNGTWGNAIEVPGTATLNTLHATTRTLSCASAGNCSAGGYYNNGTGHAQAWVAEETNGTWGTAIPVPGVAALNSGTGGAAVVSNSCSTPGNCVAGGYYADANSHSQVWTATETNGTWGTAAEIPGSDALNSGGNAKLISLSCGSSGNCVAGGHYYDASAFQQAFLAEETAGTWGTAVEVPGTATANTAGYADVASVSCATAGNCVAGGFYAADADNDQDGDLSAFVINETDGTWGNVLELPGTVALDGGEDAQVNSVSCANPDYCAAVGTYEDFNGEEAFVANAAPLGAIFVAPAAVTASYGGTTTVSATLTSGGNPLPGETLSFTLNGTSLGDAVTDVNGVATLQNVSLSGINPGTYPSAIAASFAGDGPFPASSGSNALTISQLTQTISITTHAPTDASYGDHFTVAATGGASGNPVTYGSSGSCLNIGASYTMIGSGQCTVIYDQSGSTIYAAAELTEIVTGHKANQTITFPTPAGKTYGNSDFDPGASSSSGGAIAYGAAGACSIVSGKVHLTGAGSCTVAADQAGDANYNPATRVQRTFSVGKAPLSITANNQHKFVGDSLTLGTTAFTPSGLVGSDSVSGVTLTSTGAAAPAASGDYPIVPSAAVAGPNTDLDANYTITYHNGTLQVLAPSIVGLSGVTVATSGGMIDSFDSSLGVYGPLNHGSSAFVASNGPLSFAGVSLFGNATSTQSSVTVKFGSAVSGNVTAGTTASILGNVGGTVTQNAPSTPIPVPTVSVCAPFSPKTGISGGSFSYSSGNLTVKLGTVKLASKTYCFNNVTIAAGATLSVPAPVTMNLTGKLTGKGKISNTANRPANLHIVSSYNGLGGIAIAGGNRAAMTILAPQTSATISGGSFFGTVFAATVNLTGGLKFHADTH